MHWKRNVIKRKKTGIGLFFMSNFGQKNRNKQSLFRNGAEDEIRTRDVHLGKVTLYH